MAQQIQERYEDSKLYRIRHSSAHVMARAVMRLFPGVQLAFGPTIENGFYYDFQMEHALSEEDFPRIEALPGHHLYENQHVLPRFFLVDETHAVGSLEEALAALAAPGFDPRRVAVRRRGRSTPTVRSSTG